MIAKANNRIARNLISQLPTRDVVWAALEKVSAKQANYSEILDGSRHVVNFDVQGLIDGQLFRQSVDSIISVGNRQTRSSSFTPGVPEVLAFILGKLNHATRERILNDVPVEFAANQCLIPAPDAGLQEQVRHMLMQLRRTRTVEARGAIKCEFMLTN